MEKLMITLPPLTEEETNIILAGLGELPAKVSGFLLVRLKATADVQYTDFHKVNNAEQMQQDPRSAQ